MADAILFADHPGERNRGLACTEHVGGAGRAAGTHARVGQMSIESGNGHDPNQWPWLWSSYRRRTRRLQPGAYELAAPELAAADSARG